MVRILFRAVLLAALPIAAAAAYPPDDCVTSGMPARIAATFGPLVMPVPAGSMSSGIRFTVDDAAGHHLIGAEVEFTSASPAAVTFLQPDGTPVAGPQRVRVKTTYCEARSPAFVTGLRSGSASITARVVAAPGVPARALPPPVTIPVKVVGPSAYEEELWSARRDRKLLTAVAGAVTTSVPRARVTWLTWDAPYADGGLAGKPVTFSASHPGTTFSNGAASISVTTDVMGYAEAPAKLGPIPPEGLSILAQVANGPPKTVTTYYNAAALSIAIDAPQPIIYGDESAYLLIVVDGWPCVESWEGNGEGRFFLRSANAATPLQDWGDRCWAHPEAPLTHLGPGTHELWVEFVGEMHPPVRSPPITVTVEPDTALPSARGLVTLGLSMAPPQNYADDGPCGIGNQGVGLAGEPGMPAAGPPVDTPWGLVRFDLLECWWGNWWSLPTGPVVQRIVLESTEDLPPGTSVWAFGPDGYDEEQKWREIPATLDKRSATFDLVGNLSPTIAFGVPASSVADYEGIWWVGPEEEDWGLSLSQRGDRLYGVLFVHDDAGKPRWLTLPVGQWDAGKRILTSPAYRPRGAPFDAYSAAQFRQGLPVGTVALEFASPDTLTMRLKIDGVSKTKRLQRKRFSMPSVIPGYPLGGLWWGGEDQRGWLLAVHQQGLDIRAYWFTYDDAGETTWFMAPAGKVSEPYAYLGASMVQTEGPSWLLARRDPPRSSSKEVGALELSMRGYLPWKFYARVGDRRASTALHFSRFPF